MEAEGNLEGGGSIEARDDLDRESVANYLKHQDGNVYKDITDDEVKSREDKKEKNSSGSVTVAPRPSLRELNLASLPLEWRVVASLPSLAPSLTHLDLSMCISGVNDKSIQVKLQSYL